MSGELFISYRRADSSGFAGRIYDHLQARVPAGCVFMDVDGILPGADFVEVIQRQVDTCKVVLAVIGPDWLSAVDEDGQRRIDSSADFVRIELEAALARNIPLIPLLVEGARMPRADELPEELKRVARRQAYRITHEHFGSDFDRLMTLLRPLLGLSDGSGPQVNEADAPLYPNIILSEQQLTKFVDGWEGAGIYVLHKNVNTDGDRQAPQGLRELRRSFFARHHYSKPANIANIIAEATRQHCAIPSNEHMGAVFLSFKNGAVYRCLATCQSGFYYFHSEVDGPLERHHISFSTFLSFPVEMEHGRLMLGGVRRYLTGYSFNFSDRDIRKYLVELQDRIRNEVRFNSATQTLRRIE